MAQQQGINPFAIAQKSSEGVIEIAAPNILIMAGRTNRNDAAFQKAREKGAEVFPYFNVVEAPDTPVSSLDDEFYMGDCTAVPRWPYPTPGHRRLWDDQHSMTDLRAGTPWPDYAIEYISAKIFASDDFDGVYLDVIGGRLWPKSPPYDSWDSWPKAEQQEWQAGVTDFMRRLDARRREINPGKKIINNNTWQHNEGCTQYVDGICIEHIKPSNTYTVGWASKEFGSLGQRRVVIIANVGDTAFWKGIPGVTHIGETPNGYGSVAAPTVPYVNVQQQDIEAKAREDSEAVQPPEPEPAPEPEPLAGIVAIDVTAVRVSTNADGSLVSAPVALTPLSTCVQGDRCTIEAQLRL